MQEEIQLELTRLEQKHDIKILFAVESGSRAWGFASTDSDWDVRFVYIHRPEWYLRIDAGKDNMEEILSNDIDLAGWELKKALRLFRKSNPPLLEWLRSPIVYSEKYSTARNMRLLENEFINPVSCLYHYLSMAYGNFRDYLHTDMVRTKKYFYVLRPVLACRWIYMHQTVPPIEFSVLLEAASIKDEVSQILMTLLERKKKGEELSLEPKIQELNDYLNTEIEFFSQYVKTLEKPKTPDTAVLDKLFVQTMKEVWNG